MNEAQVWVAIGLLASMLLSVMAVVAGSFVRLMRAEFRAFRFEMRSEFKSLRADIAGIDRDVQVLYRRAFGGESE